MYSPDGSAGVNGTNDWQENFQEVHLQVGEDTLVGLPFTDVALNSVNAGTPPVFCLPMAAF
jgi:hypothetical protein